MRTKAQLVSWESVSQIVARTCIKTNAADVSKLIKNLQVTHYKDLEAPGIVFA